MERKVLAALPMDDLHLIVWFESGVTKRLDAHVLLDREEFRAITQPAFFKRARVRPDGLGVTWGSGVSLSSDEIYEASQDVDIVESEKHRLLEGLAEARHSSNLSQVKLGEAAGIRQPVISRIEGGDIAPQINTLFKLLAPMGKTLEIVDLKNIEGH